MVEIFLKDTDAFCLRAATLRLHAYRTAGIFPLWRCTIQIVQMGSRFYMKTSARHSSTPTLVLRRFPVIWNALLFRIILFAIFL
jgi:hypothetical protein